MDGRRERAAEVCWNLGMQARARVTMMAHAANARLTYIGRGTAALEYISHVRARVRRQQLHSRVRIIDPLALHS